MASALEQQVQSVLSDSRSARYNVPASDRTYLEILSDPAAGDLIRRDVVEAFREQFISSPPVRQQEMRGIETDDPSYVPMEAPAGGLQTGEYIDEEGSISYDSELEATQSQAFDINIGSLTGGKMTREGLFLPGPARPGLPVVRFSLPEGMRPDEISQSVYDVMIRVAKDQYEEEFQRSKEYDSALKSGAIAATREAVLGIPALLDMPSLAVRAVDYIVSPVGTNTLGNDTARGLAAIFGADYEPPRPDSIYQDTFPRLFERLGAYTTEYPNALFEPNVVIEPDRALMPIHAAFGKLLDETLVNMGSPGYLTPEQDSEAQKIAAFIGSVMGGSLSASGAVRAASKLVARGLKVEDLTKVGALNRALYSLANSPGVSFLPGKLGRRFAIPGTPSFLLQDQAAGLVSAGAMLLTPDEWGPNGKLMAGLTAPFALSKALAVVRQGPTGQAFSFAGGFMEPFTLSGQRTLAARFVASVPGVKGNEQTVLNLLNDTASIRRKPGQDELVTTPAYFSDVAGYLRRAEADWNKLRQNGVSDADAVAQLSQDPVYGKYFSEVSVFGGAEPTLDVLSSAATSVKLVSDNLYGAMSWLQTGSPIKNEVLRATGERLRRAEEAFKNLSRNFEGNPADARKYLEETAAMLDDLAADSMQTHAVDAALYIQLKQRLEDAGGPSGLLELSANNSRVAVRAVENSLKEIREIESALWKNIDADGIEISPESMALIGDKAAEIILSTPVAQRNQIPASLYQLAGRNRLLSESGLESMAGAAGASQEIPAAIRNARARLAGLVETRNNLESRPYEDPAFARAERTLENLRAQRADESYNSLTKARQAALDQKIVSATSDLRSRREKAAALNPDLDKVNDKIREQQAALDVLEESLIPKTTADDQAIVAGPNGILDSVNTLDEVLAARGALLDAAAAARSRAGGANTARLANIAQKYIIEDWLQNPDVFGASGSAAAYDAARQFSVRVNDLYTRNDSILTKFLSQDRSRSAGQSPETFLLKIINDNEFKPRTDRPTGSLADFDAALVKARAPFLVRDTDGALVVERGVKWLTPGLEDISWESILAPGGETLSGALLREELLNQLALIAFNNGKFQQNTVQKAIRSWDSVIARVENDFPDFRSELNSLVNSGEDLVARSKALETMTKRQADEALATRSLDEVAGAQDAGLLSRRVQADHSVAQVFLDNGPDVVARKLLSDPSTLQNDLPEILRILGADESGAALDGFKRALFNELLNPTFGTPGAAGRAAGESVIDPTAVNNLLVENETALRSVFGDRVGPEGSNMTTYDMIKMFNDETSAVLAERAGAAAGAASVPVTAPIRGREMIRNFGRMAGVKAASMSGGPPLVMAGQGGRIADKLVAQGKMSNVYALVSDAIVDPALARLLLTDESTLTRSGRFNFSKKLEVAVRPYIFYAGRPTTAVKAAVDDQRELDRLLREGGETEIYYDEGTDRYIRARPDERSSVQPVAPPRRRMASNAPLLPPSIVPGSALNQVNPLGGAPVQQAALAAQGPGSPQVAEQGRSIFGMNDPVFAARGGHITGIMAVKPKPRQMVG
jgi:hypothetical protein